MHHDRNVTGPALRRRSRLREGPYAARVLAMLRSWPALVMHDHRDGAAFAVEDTEILRLAGEDRFLVRLTVPVIGRLGSFLEDSGKVKPCEDRAWVCVRVEAEPDLHLLLSLTSVAIKANTAPE